MSNLFWLTGGQVVRLEPFLSRALAVRALMIVMF